jgi:hypothetical protein
MCISDEPGAGGAGGPRSVLAEAIGPNVKTPRH